MNTEQHFSGYVRVVNTAQPPVVEAIPTPEVIEHSLPPADEPAVKDHKHAWNWVWVGDQWTNRVRCTTCGLVRNALSIKQDRSQ